MSLNRNLVITLSALLFVTNLSAQSKKDPLSEQQIEEVREVGDQPAVRIKLFVGYLDDRAKQLQSLDKDAIAQNRNARTHTLFEDFTRLADDLQDNMDAFNDQHADLRKILKDVVDKSAEWTKILNEPKPNAQYDFGRKSALDANQSVHEGATQMLADQVKYFAEKKKADKEAEKKAADSETR